MLSLLVFLAGGYHEELSGLALVLDLLLSLIRTRRKGKRRRGGGYEGCEEGIARYLYHLVELELVLLVCFEVLVLVDSRLVSNDLGLSGGERARGEELARGDNF